MYPELFSTICLENNIKNALMFVKTKKQKIQIKSELRKVYSSDF